MPQGFQEFQSHVRNKLSDYIKRTIKILRWRNNIGGKHNPIQATRGLFWSFDCKTWKHMPDDSILIISEEQYLPITKKLQNTIQKMVVDEIDEPLGHTLLREAWEQKERNPRSSLILGIVAIEVGFKQCVGTLLPKAQWLVENVPSPPIPKMLWNYLPQLPTKLKIKGKVLPPPKSIKTVLQNGIEQRNKTIHVGSLPPNYEDLEELLLAIRDSLYLLDYYCGVKWALDNIQETTINFPRGRAARY